MGDQIKFSAGENPYAVEYGGFYRRWMPMLTDIDELVTAVGKIKSTTEESWIPVWSAFAYEHERKGDEFIKGNKQEKAYNEFMLAKTYLSIARYPGEITESKRKISAECSRVYRKACELLEPKVEVVKVSCGDKEITCHFRCPNGADKTAAVLIMCGADMFKEDRGWASQHAIDNGLASLVMDGPATGENPFPWEPESVSAWMAAIDYLAGRPEVDENKIGAFGISRGGYSVVQLAGSYPEMVKAIVANAGHPFGYKMTEEEMINFVKARNDRAQHVFGQIGDPPSFPPWTAEKEQMLFEKWSLSSLGILDKINQPMLLINGKKDHLAPIGNIYFMLENGPPHGREARIYPDAGHCAFKYQDHWAAASFEWLSKKLS